MTEIVFLGIFLFLFVFMIGNGYVINKKKTEKLICKLKEDYGKENQRKWTPQELEKISHYSKKRSTKESIDELTWNDLDMDLIFRQMAYTGSSVGDDYLYFLLHNPAKEKMVLLEREKKLSCLENQEETRIKLQVLFADIGRIKKYSFSDYITYLMQENAKSNRIHYAVIFLIIFSLFFMQFHLYLGMGAFFLLILYNITAYFKDKAFMEPYLISLRYLLKSLKDAGELVKILPEEWNEEKEQLEKILFSMKKVQKNSFLVGVPGRMAGEGIELILDYLRMCLHLDLIKFNQMLYELQQKENEIWKLYEILGEADACTAIVQYRKFLKQTCKPEFENKKQFFARGIYHPLLENPVSNSFSMERSMLLTGSNASGKSTFLKTTAINILLAQTIHTCTAEEVKLPFSSLYTSMSVKDSLELKESYYVAEVKAIKRILDAAKEEKQVICMIDEVLRGTNTLERIAASTQILKTMAEQGVLCIAATHDVELTKTLEKDYENYHFEKSVVKGEVFFSYQLKKGREEGCNAIDLLAHLGYDNVLIEKAREMIKNFTERGEWICR